VSLEHEIESRKTAYYRELQKCQAQRPGENISSWLTFFFDTLLKVQQQLLQKLTVRETETQSSPREKAVLAFVGNYPGCKSGQIAGKLAIPSPTVKRILADLLAQHRLTKEGKGPATIYYVS
jgi:Fic family protein